MASKSALKKILQRQKQAIYVEVQRELEDTGEEWKQHNEDVVRPWTHRPKFRAYRTLTSTRKVIEIRPQGAHAKLWVWVDRGTKPHTITAVNVPNLKFQTGHSARTAPVAKAHVGTGRRFGSWVSKKTVRHPGTKARQFDVTFFKELAPPFEDRIQAAIQRGINKANR